MGDWLQQLSGRCCQYQEEDTPRGAGVEEGHKEG